MPHAMKTSVVLQIESLYGGASVTGLSDRQLIELFVARRDAAGEAAFVALVARHGPMVLGVCRQLLGDYQHAEDAFQAVFLVLARRAGSVRDPDLLSNWLYGVTLRTGRKARARLARRRECEEDRAMNRLEACAAVPVDQPMIECEEAAALHAEIDRLPASSRVPVVLCYFEGLSLAEAAERLRCPAGTVHSRLARARERLRRGLVRRGIVCSAAMLDAATEPRSASAFISPLLRDSTTRAAIGSTGRHAAGGALSPTAANLARDVLRTMVLHKLKTTALSLFLVAALATGAGYVTRSLATRRDDARKASRTQIASKPNDAPRPAPGRMFVVGRVLDPAGKPTAGVAVDVVGRPRLPWVATKMDWDDRVLIGRGETGAEGRFRFDAARTVSTRFFEVDILAAAPCYGLGWARLNPDAAEPTAEIRLGPEQTIRGKLVNINGQPAAAVEIQVGRVGRWTDMGTFDGVESGRLSTARGPPCLAASGHDRCPGPLLARRHRPGPVRRSGGPRSPLRPPVA